MRCEGRGQSKTRGCTLPEGDNEYGGMGMSRESRRAWALGVGGNKQKQSGRQANCRAGEEQTGLQGGRARSRVELLEEAEAEAEARGCRLEGEEPTSRASAAVLYQHTTAAAP